MKVDLSLYSVKILGTEIGSLFAIFSENSWKLKVGFSLYMFDELCNCAPTSLMVTVLFRNGMEASD